MKNEYLILRLLRYNKNLQRHKSTDENEITNVNKQLVNVNEGNISDDLINTIINRELPFIIDNELLYDIINSLVSTIDITKGTIHNSDIKLAKINEILNSK